MTAARGSLLLAIRPEFAEEIYAGRKTAELRPYPIAAGTPVWLYETGGQRMITGSFVAGENRVVYAGEALTADDRARLRLDIPSRWSDHYKGEKLKDRRQHIITITGPARLENPVRWEGTPPQGRRWLPHGLMIE